METFFQIMATTLKHLFWYVGAACLFFGLNDTMRNKYCHCYVPVLGSMTLLNHRSSLLFISGHTDCYPPVSVNISILHLLFIPMQQGNHVIGLWSPRHQEDSPAVMHQSIPAVPIPPLG